MLHYLSGQDSGALHVVTSEGFESNTKFVCLSGPFPGCRFEARNCLHMNWLMLHHLAGQGIETLQLLAVVGYETASSSMGCSRMFAATFKMTLVY